MNSGQVTRQNRLKLSLPEFAIVVDSSPTVDALDVVSK